MTTLDEFMAAIRQVESGNRYDIGHNASGASGAYQFIDSTWGNFGGYKSAYLAPPEVQDERARQLMQAYYDQFGDWDHVAAAWIGGPGTAAKGPGAWGGIHDSNMSVASYVARVNSHLGASGEDDLAYRGRRQINSQGTVSAGAPAVPRSELGGNLQGVADVASGTYTQTSTVGDTLGDRLKAIMQIVGGQNVG